MTAVELPSPRHTQVSSTLIRTAQGPPSFFPIRPRLPRRTCTPSADRNCRELVACLCLSPLTAENESSLADSAVHWRSTVGRRLHVRACRPAQWSWSLSLPFQRKGSVLRTSKLSLMLLLLLHYLAVLALCFPFISLGLFPCSSPSLCSCEFRISVAPAPHDRLALPIPILDSHIRLHMPI